MNLKTVFAVMYVVAGVAAVAFAPAALAQHALNQRFLTSQYGSSARNSTEADKPKSKPHRTAASAVKNAN